MVGMLNCSKLSTQTQKLKTGRWFIIEAVSYGKILIVTKKQLQLCSTERQHMALTHSSNKDSNSEIEEFASFLGLSVSELEMTISNMNSM